MEGLTLMAGMVTDLRAVTVIVWESLWEGFTRGFRGLQYQLGHMKYLSHAGARLMSPAFPALPARDM